MPAGTYAVNFNMSLTAMDVHESAIFLFQTGIDFLGKFGPKNQIASLI